MIKVLLVLMLIATCCLASYGPLPQKPTMIGDALSMHKLEERHLTIAAVDTKPDGALCDAVMTAYFRDEKGPLGVKPTIYYMNINANVYLVLVVKKEAADKVKLVLID